MPRGQAEVWRMRKAQPRSWAHHFYFLSTRLSPINSPRGGRSCESRSDGVRAGVNTAETNRTIRPKSFFIYLSYLSSVIHLSYLFIYLLTARLLLNILQLNKLLFGDNTKKSDVQTMQELWYWCWRKPGGKREAHVEVKVGIHSCWWPTTWWKVPRKRRLVAYLPTY